MYASPNRVKTMSRTRFDRVRTAATLPGCQDSGARAPLSYRLEAPSA